MSTSPKVARLLAQLQAALLETAAPGALSRAPRIGADWPAQGGVLGGICAGPEGDYALIVSPKETEGEDLTWKAACSAFKGFPLAGHSDWDLPTRDELRALCANVPGLFEATGWYWSRTESQYARYSAWVQDFERGYSDYGGKVSEFRARAVRRVPLQPFDTSAVDTAAGAA